jgi:UDP-glucose 4-epimerase
MISSELAETFRGSKVLITGGLGFIGSNLARELVLGGAQVTLVDTLVPEHGGNLTNIAGFEDAVAVHAVDIRDSRALEPLVRGTDVLFNLAGQTSHLDSMTDPFTDLDLNSRGQLSILEVCRYTNPELKVVFASTRQIYGRPRYLPVDEEHPIAPVDVNGINKAAGEAFHLLYGEVYGLRVCALRLTNVYGPRMRVRDARQTFLGIWLKAVLKGEEIEVWGDGTQRRDLLYVEDVTRAFLLAGSRTEADGEIFNVGVESSISLLELAELLVAIHGGGSFRTIPFPADRKAIDIGDYFTRADKIRASLGWDAAVTLEDGLRRTLAYYAEYGEAYWA